MRAKARKIPIALLTVWQRAPPQDGHGNGVFLAARVAEYALARPGHGDELSLELSRADRTVRLVVVLSGGRKRAQRVLTFVAIGRGNRVADDLDAPGTRRKVRQELALGHRKAKEL